MTFTDGWRRPARSVRMEEQQSTGHLHRTIGKTDGSRSLNSGPFYSIQRAFDTWKQHDNTGRTSSSISRSIPTDYQSNRSINSGGGKQKNLKCKQHIHQLPISHAVIDTQLTITNSDSIVSLTWLLTTRRLPPAK